MEVSNLRPEITSLFRRSTLLRDEIMTLGDELTLRDKRIDELTEALQNSKREIVGLYDRIAQFETTRKTNIDTLAGERRRAEEAERREGELAEVLQNSKKEIVELRDRIVHLEQENDSLQTKTTMSEGEIGQLYHHIAQLEKEKPSSNQLAFGSITWEKRAENAEQQIEKLENAELEETTDLRYKISTLQEDRELLNILIKNAALILTQAIGDELTDAEKNKAICKAIYPLIEQIPI